MYVDVLSESVNNPLRMLLGWFMVTSVLVPPVSLLICYWMAGCYLMALKRFSEYREIGDPEVAGAANWGLGIKKSVIVASWAAIFYLPTLFPIQPSASDSYVFGYNNRAGVAQSKSPSQSSSYIMFTGACGGVKTTEKASQPPMRSGTGEQAKSVWCFLPPSLLVVNRILPANNWKE